MKMNLTSAAVLAGTLLTLASPAFAFQVDVANAPDSSLGLTLAAIQSARTSLQLNIYELSSGPIAQAIEAKIQQGVRVVILEEGQPLGGIPAPGRAIQAELAQVMRQSGHSEDLLLEMTSAGASGPVRRYRYDHAKYMVIDGNSLVIGSDNYGDSGQPSAHQKGDRGWEVWIHEPGVAAYFAQIYSNDADPRRPDIRNLVTASADTAPLPHSPANPRMGYSSFDASSVSPITSPETSEKGLVEILNSAKNSLDIEQMSFESAWSDPCHCSPVYDAVVAAARRGVHVRVLLNNDAAFANGSSSELSSGNSTTASRMKEIATRENLPLEVRIANLHSMGVSFIHNKGVLIDGTDTLVSSINWTENAIRHNREAGVVLKSPAVNQYFSSLFNQDWARSSQ